MLFIIKFIAKLINSSEIRAPTLNVIPQQHPPHPQTIPRRQTSRRKAKSGHRKYYSDAKNNFACPNVLFNELTQHY